MEQIAMVKSILDNGMAQVAVQRETACGAAHSCADCAGCEKMMTRTENVVVAYNDVNAHPGDVVKVQSENGNFFKTAAIVYLLPLVLALVFYGVASALSLGGEGLHALCAGIGFVLGILVAIICILLPSLGRQFEQGALGGDYSAPAADATGLPE